MDQSVFLTQRRKDKTQRYSLILVFLCSFAPLREIVR